MKNETAFGSFTIIFFFSLFYRLNDIKQKLKQNNINRVKMVKLIT